MNKIAIITGDGNLPLHIGNSLESKNFNILFLILNNVKNKKKYQDKNHIIIDILSIKKIVKVLKKNDIEGIILAGSIRRPSITDLSFDFETVKLAKKLLLEKKGDNNLLVSIKQYFESKNFIFFNWVKHCPELFSLEANLTNYKPSGNAKKNFLKAKSIYKYFSNTDIGQSIVIQNQLILGVEAIEGTDRLIERCYNYKRSGDKGILIKFSKKNQSKLIDIPTIGLDTIKNIIKFKFEGVYLEKNNCIIVDKEEIIDLANRNKIFVSSVDLN